MKAHPHARPRGNRHHTAQAVNLGWIMDSEGFASYPKKPRWATPFRAISSRRLKPGSAATGFFLVWRIQSARLSIIKESSMLQLTISSVSAGRGTSSPFSVPNAPRMSLRRPMSHGCTAITKWWTVNEITTATTTTTTLRDPARPRHHGTSILARRPLHAAALDSACTTTIITLLARHVVAMGSFLVTLPVLQLGYVYRDGRDPGLADGELGDGVPHARCRIVVGRAHVRVGWAGHDGEAAGLERRPLERPEEQLAARRRGLHGLLGRAERSEGGIRRLDGGVWLWNACQVGHFVGAPVGMDGILSSLLSLLSLLLLLLLLLLNGWHGTRRMQRKDRDDAKSQSLNQVGTPAFGQPPLLDYGTPALLVQRSFSSGFLTDCLPVRKFIIAVITW